MSASTTGEENRQGGKQGIVYSMSLIKKDVIKLLTPTDANCHVTWEIYVLKVQQLLVLFVPQTEEHFFCYDSLSFTDYDDR